MAAARAPGVPCCALRRQGRPGYLHNPNPDPNPNPNPNRNPNPNTNQVDPDAFIVWPRLRALLETAYAARGSTQLLVGYLEWVSYLPDEGRFCGCCGYSRGHATMLQLARASFGP